MARTSNLKKAGSRIGNISAPTVQPTQTTKVEIAPAPQKIAAKSSKVVKEVKSSNKDQFQKLIDNKELTETVVEVKADTEIIE